MDEKTNVEGTNIEKTNNKGIIDACIVGGCAVIAAIIGVFSYNINTQNDGYEEVKLDNLALAKQVKELQEECKYLREQYIILEQNITDLQNEIENFNTESPQTIETSKSIFDLEPIKNDMNSNDKYWFNHSDGYSPECFVDEDGVEYYTAYMGFHYGTDKKDILNPTYQLNNNFSVCKGEIIWSKTNENSKAKAWIEFYSGDTLIYTTDPVDKDNKSAKFDFSVEGVYQLKIVKNGTESQYGNLTVIYPYLNLIK